MKLQLCFSGIPLEKVTQNSVHDPTEKWPPEPPPSRGTALTLSDVTERTVANSECTLTSYTHTRSGSLSIIQNMHTGCLCRLTILEIQMRLFLSRYFEGLVTVTELASSVCDLLCLFVHPLTGTS